MQKIEKLKKWPNFKQISKKKQELQTNLKFIKIVKNTFGVTNEKTKKLYQK